MKKILYLLIIGGLIGGAYGYYLYNKPVQSLKDTKADAVVAAEAFLAEFESNETAANEKYLDKVVSVKGTVTKTEEKSGRTSLFLKGSDMSSIICELESSIENAASYVGKEVSVKGQCTGYLMDVVITKANIE